MKLKIEKWIEERNPFGVLAKDLFAESVQCYKIGAYKSSFIMSYLSFKITIRDRIIECSYGEELKKSNPRFWENEILKNLQNDEKWEEYLNTIIEASCATSSNKKDIAIIHFGNENLVRNEYTYWKNIRNACAHAKSQIIDSSTVECFWNYIMDNLGMFYVLGGEEYLLKELLNCYKYYEYPEIINPEKLSNLISDINSVYKTNTADFFQSFFNALNYPYINNKLEFWKKIFESYENIQNGIVEIVSKSELLFLEFYKHFPKILEMSVALNSKFVVDVLSGWMKTLTSSGNYGHVFWDLLVHVINSYPRHISVGKIINENNIDYVRCIDKDDNKVEVLNRNDVFKKYIFSISSWFFKTDSDSQYRNFIAHNNNFNNIEKCFSLMEWDIDCVKKLDDALVSLEDSMGARSNPYMRQNGYDFLSSCKRIVTENKEKIEKISGIDLNQYSQIKKILDSIQQTQDVCADL